MQNGYITKNNFDKKTLFDNLNKINLTFKFNKDIGYAEMYLNNKNVEEEIRGLKVSNFVSQVAALPQVRKKLVEQQKKMSKNKGVVMDGRDIGTVVLPDAELKIFMTASAHIRAKRRYNELLAKGEKVVFNQIKQNIEQRDKIDTTRVDSPLVQAKDAILFDNSNLSKKEQFEKLLNLVNKTIN